MSVKLYRVDDRLIHGQVVVGWAQPLGIQFILVVDDAVAHSDWEKDLYRMGVPAGVEVLFATVEEACSELPRLVADPRRGMVLTSDIQTMSRLHDRTNSFREVNLGGIHTGPGRSPCLRYVYLSTEEERELRSLSDRGVSITAQDLPVAKPMSLEDVLAARRAT